MAALSGKKVVAVPGTAVQLGAATFNGPMIVKALPTNTDKVYLGNDGAGDVSSANGLALAAGDSVILAYVSNLSQLWLDAVVGGEGVTWLSLDV